MLKQLLVQANLQAVPEQLYIDSDTLVGTLDYGSLRVAAATMGYKHFEMDKEKAKREICRPNFMVKIATDYNGDLRVCDLVRTQITNIEVKGAWTGPARLQLFEHALARARACSNN